MISRLLLLLIFIGIALPSCTSKVQEAESESAASKTDVSKQTCEGAACAVCELPWGGSIGPGQSVEESYSKSLIECSEKCSSFKVKLTCQNGKLVGQAADGSAFNAIAALSKTCHVKHCDCTYAGTVVQDGNTRDFFKKSSAACGTKCEARNFTCQSGKLVDTAAPTQASTIATYANSSCTEVPCKSCTTPWGTTVDHSKTTVAYKSDGAGCAGTTCSGISTTLTCQDGILSGGNLSLYKYGTCTVRPCQNCTLPSGDTLAHNATAPVYQVATVPCNATCAQNSVNMTCSDGQLSGGDPNVYKYSSCSSGTCKTCTLPCGIILGSGGIAACYKLGQQTSCAATCLSERKQFKCIDGVSSEEDGSPLVGAAAYTFNACTENASCSSCQLPDGRSVLDGKKMTFFKQSTFTCGKSCLTTDNSVTLTCSNGTFANQALYPGFNKTECKVDCRASEGDLGLGRVNGDGGGAPVVWCQIPWSGRWASHNTTITAFSVMKAPTGHKCSEYKARITCNAYRGLWSGGGTYVYSMCKE